MVGRAGLERAPWPRRFNLGRIWDDVEVMRFVASLGIAGALLLAACSAENQAIRPEAQTVPAPATTASVSVPPTSDGVTTSTSASQDKLRGTFEPRSNASEPEDLPQFLVALREGGAVVEIETKTGREVRVLIPAPTVLAAEDELDGNSIGAVWWHRESGRMVVEDGPEPASGNIWHLPIDANFELARTLSFNDIQGFRYGGGWQAEISPNGDYVLHTGYFASILRNGVPDNSSIDVSRPGDAGSSFYFMPTWLRDRNGVAFVVETFADEPEVVELDVVDLDSRGEVVDRRSLPLEHRVAGLAVRSDGAILILADEGDQRRLDGSEVTVIDPDSFETIAEFELEPGSGSMGYDPTGTFLLYVDGNGGIRWQGRGQSALIASGFTHADW